MFKIRANLIILCVALAMAGCSSSIRAQLLPPAVGSVGDTATPAATPTPDPLFVGNVGYWKLSETAGATTAADSSNFANNGTMSGTATFGNAGHTGSASSASFDGTTSLVSIPNIANYTMTQMTASA
ncbi:MAG: hypothetical protein JST80_08405 [Bdellovibrionales bacterium]|nr:hypothetical protein [Bdellovibrionales bacterium]